MLRSLVALGCIGFVLAGPVRAAELSASSIASSASESVSTSVGSLSASVTQSSQSSTGEKVAEGDYRVRDVATLPDRPGLVLLTLQPVARPGTHGELKLTLPLATAERARLAAGGTVHVRQRSFGLEFAPGATQGAFFLAVTDEWLRDLVAHPVTL